MLIYSFMASGLAHQAAELRWTCVCFHHRSAGVSQWGHNAIRVGLRDLMSAFETVDGEYSSHCMHTVLESLQVLSTPPLSCSLNSL